MFYCKLSLLVVLASILIVGQVAGETPDALQPSEPPVTALRFTPGGESLVALSQAGPRLYDWPDLRLQREIPWQTHNAHALAFSPDGSKLAIAGGIPGEEGVLQVLSWPKAELLASCEAPFDVIMALVWEGDDVLWAASMDHLLYRVRASDGELLETLRGHSRGVTGLAFLPEQNQLVSAALDQSLRVWDLQSKQMVRSLSIHTQPILDLQLAPHLEGLPMVASASEDKSVRLWQPTIGRMVRFVRLETVPLHICWTHDGSRIAAACVDGRVRIIDPLRVTVTQTLPRSNSPSGSDSSDGNDAPFEGWTYAVEAHPTDGTLAVGGSGGVIRRWRWREGDSDAETTPSRGK